MNTNYSAVGPGWAGSHPCVRHGLTPMSSAISSHLQRALALVLQVVDHKRRDDCVEPPEVGQRLGQIMLDQLDALVAVETLMCQREHDVREVDAHAGNRRTIGLQ
jgi:hypothetical protein